MHECRLDCCFQAICPPILSHQHSRFSKCSPQSPCMGILGTGPYSRREPCSRPFVRRLGPGICMFSTQPTFLSHTGETENLGFNAFCDLSPYFPLQFSGKRSVIWGNIAYLIPGVHSLHCHVENTVFVKRNISQSNQQETHFSYV